MPNKRDVYRILQIDSEAHEVVVRAAYRALAALYHPDRDSSPLATRRMAELNDAYDRLRAMRQGDESPPVVVAGTSAHASRPSDKSGSRRTGETVDFGRYAGWSIQQLAAHDPDYLIWLSRHSSGIRYRQAIDEVLAPIRAAREPASAAGKRRR